MLELRLYIVVELSGLIMTELPAPNSDSTRSLASKFSLGYLGAYWLSLQIILKTLFISTIFYFSIWAGESGSQISTFFLNFGPVICVFVLKLNWARTESLLSIDANLRPFWRWFLLEISVDFVRVEFSFEIGIKSPFLKNSDFIWFYSIFLMFWVKMFWFCLFHIFYDFSSFLACDEISSFSIVRKFECWFLKFFIL